MVKQQQRMFLSISLLVICGSSELHAQRTKGDIAAQLNKIVSERFAATRCPGLSVVVALKNEIVFSSAQGMADVEQGVALEKDSVHRLASLSKVITGTIIMDLVAQRKLNFDTSVKRYLPELPEPYQGVTLRHLLDHQSGVRRYEDPLDVAFSMAHYATSRDAMKTFMAYPLAFPPGTKTEYGSLSFTVAAAAAESVTGRSFQEISRDFFVRHG